MPRGKGTEMSLLAILGMDGFYRALRLGGVW